MEGDRPTTAAGSFSEAVVGELERRVVQPTRRRALPLLQRLPALVHEQRAAVRATLAADLVSEDAQAEGATAEIVTGDEPPLLGKWTADWRDNHTAELQDDALRLAGEPAATLLVVLKYRLPLS